MRKLLTTSALASMLIFAASPSNAQVSLDLGGHYKGYLSFVDQDEVAGGLSVRELDWQQETEIHFTGETTLDNGLTVGFHAEADVDGNGADQFQTEEAYAYFSGAWGRVNAGREDGATYLLQIAAPSADSNVDGIRQYVQGVNYAALPLSIAATATAAGLVDVTLGADGVDGADDVRIDAGANLATSSAFSDVFRFDYDQNVAGRANKLTYMTPVFNGFQLGASYTPDMDDSTRDVLTGNSIDGNDQYGDVYEIAARYEGQFDQVGFSLGAGYTHASYEDNDAGEDTVAFIDADNNGAFTAGETVVASYDDRQAWNVGLDLDFGPFGVGAIYKNDDLGISDDADRDTFVVGADYTTGPFKLGISYLDQDQELFGVDVETQRYSGGVVYTYGPGMTFRGSLGHIEHEVDNSGLDGDATYALVGTQINF